MKNKNKRTFGFKLDKKVFNDQISNWHQNLMSNMTFANRELFDKQLMKELENTKKIGSKNNK